MYKKGKKLSGRQQDNFDRAFIRIIDELQGKGYCKNISALEKYLKIPRQTLYQVLNGSRGLPLLHRDKVIKFFTGRYDINPAFFHNQMVNVFKNDPPMIEEDAEAYVKLKPHLSTNRLTSGDLREFETLKSENARLKETIKDRDLIIANLQKQINSMQRLLDKLSA